jgi:hypothetical protein
MPKYTDLQSILVLRSGPSVIGQAAEFDYSEEPGGRREVTPATIREGPTTVGQLTNEPRVPHASFRVGWPHLGRAGAHSIQYRLVQSVQQSRAGG